jgi:ABC-type glycerol-3-phosphate transport system substrate-binding protein
MEEIGVTLPDPQAFETTWEEILEWMQKAHKASGDKVERYGYAWAGGDSGLTIQSRWFGGDMMNAEGTKSIFQDDENALKGLRTTYDLAVNKKLCPAAGALGTGVSYEIALAEGRLAMYQGGSLNARNALQAVKDPNVCKVGCILFPKRPDGKIPSQIRGGAWQIHKTTKVPQIAYEFAYHLTSKDGCLGFNLFGGNTAFVRPDVLPLLWVQAPIFKHWESNLKSGMVINAPANSRGREFTDVMNQMGAKLMDSIKPMPFEEGVKEMATEIQKVLDTPPA